MSSYSHPRAHEWTRPLAQGVVGLLIFEALTGLANYLLPFSVANQVMVLLHTAAGFVLVIPYVAYQWRHWRIYRSLRTTHVSLTGYLAMAMVLLLIISGLVLTAQALFATRISRAWDVVHLLSTAGLLGSLVPHVATLFRRASNAADGTELKPASRAFARRAGIVGFAPLLLVPAIVLLHKPVELNNELPADYSYVFGKDRPFAPSLARTASGGAYDSRSLSGSASCGNGGCHVEVYREWEASAHRYAAMDPAFQKVQELMGEQNGPESTRYCGGCHDPISLFSGTKNIFAGDLTNLAGYQEGVSCISCHAIRETDTKGNAAFVMTQPGRYMFEYSDTVGAPRLIRDFLIRAYPRYHVATLEHKLFKSPEFCAGCHKQFIDEEINKVGWVQLQNQYDNWRTGRWNHPGDAKTTIECRECHMPLQESKDPARGDDLDYNRKPSDGKHRSHRFLGANQWIPTILKLPGAEEHVRLTEQWLRGEITVPEIADKWRDGGAVPVALRAPEVARRGEKVTVEASLRNNKVGHDYPTGPLDIIQSWVELEVTDQDGRVVFESGMRDSANFIEPGSFMLKAEPVDQNGNVIDRHNLWEMVGVRYRRAIFPGYSDKQEFTFSYPGHAKELHVRARLLYRKADQFLLNFLFGAKSGMTAPITVMSEDSKVIRVAGDD
ncbi:MAG: hypothetical protein IT356_10585 [Gemmatimonadaceae bacterium]|nr:hypothetical protein [Gemmatimonadaceae bacterium]